LHLPDGNSLIVLIGGMSVSFEHAGFVGDMAVGWQIHFSAGNGIVD
jgi:hypothetical protein